MTRLSAPQFNHDVGSAHDGPVTVTHRSEPGDALRRLEGGSAEFLSRLRTDEQIDVVFPPVTVGFRVPEL